MKVQNIFLNLIQKISKTLSSAKAYSNSNLTTAKNYSMSLRKLNYSGAISPLSADATSSWTYTAPNDGIVYGTFVSTGRSYTTISVNNVVIHYFAFSYVSSYPSNFTLCIPLSKSDVLKISGMSTLQYLSKATKFVPYKVEGGNT